MAILNMALPSRMLTVAHIMPIMAIGVQQENQQPHPRPKRSLLDLQGSSQGFLDVCGISRGSNAGTKPNAPVVKTVEPVVVSSRL